MKIIAKVIDDNGYKIELIRPVKDTPLSVGTKVEVEISPHRIDLIQIFNNLIDDETKGLILDRLDRAKKEVSVSEEQFLDD